MVDLKVVLDGVVVVQYHVVAWSTVCSMYIVYCMQTHRRPYSFFCTLRPLRLDVAGVCVRGMPRIWLQSSQNHFSGKGAWRPVHDRWNCAKNQYQQSARQEKETAYSLPKPSDSRNFRTESSMYTTQTRSPCVSVRFSP